MSQIIPAPRSKALLTLDDDGVAALDYMTSERRMATVEGPSPLRQVGLSTRGDAVLGLDADGRLTAWRSPLSASGDQLAHALRQGAI